MTAPGQTVTVLVNPALAAAQQLAERTARWLTDGGHRARVLRLTGEGRVEEGDRTTWLADLSLAGSDFAVTLGGDGTFLRLVPLAVATGTPVLGVNFGKLGYLLEVQPKELQATLGRALAGELEVADRCVIEVVADEVAPVAAGEGAQGGPARGDHWLALNEVVFQKTLFGHTVRLSTVVGGEQFLTYAADGLLVATPTGSTAYNLSAGGPVLAPDLRAMVMTPVAPHLTMDRSLVVGDGQVITVRVEPERSAALVVDGLEVGRLEPSSSVTCRISGTPLRLLTPGSQGFAGLLRASLSRRHEL